MMMIKDYYKEQKKYHFANKRKKRIREWKEERPC
jgi:hypothetical protein